MAMQQAMHLTRQALQLAWQQAMLAGGDAQAMEEARIARDNVERGYEELVAAVGSDGERRGRQEGEEYERLESRQRFDQQQEEHQVAVGQLQQERRQQEEEWQAVRRQLQQAEQGAADTIRQQEVRAAEAARGFRRIEEEMQAQMTSMGKDEDRKSVV